MQQSFLRDQDGVATTATTATSSFYPMEGWEFACLPCDSHSVDDSNADCDSLGFDTEHNSDMDSSFQSRSSKSPMAMAMAIALSRNHAASSNSNLSNNNLSNSNNNLSKSMKKKQRQRRRQQQQQRAGRQVLFPPEHSQSGEKLLLLPCRFFQTKKGCRKGISCPFDHSVAAAFERNVCWMDNSIEWIILLNG